MSALQSLRDKMLKLYFLLNLPLIIKCIILLKKKTNKLKYKNFEILMKQIRLKNKNTVDKSTDKYVCLASAYIDAIVDWQRYR